MTRSAPAAASILVASDSTTHAALVKKLLEDEFEQVRLSTHPDAAAEDFDRHRPEVLVLAFGSLEKAERHNLAIFRQSREIQHHLHQTIILCHVDDVRRAYDLCRDEIFDDYISFWPVAHDALRLPMAVRHALRVLEAHKGAGGTSSRAASHGPDLSGLEAVLSQGMEAGERHIESAGRLMAQATQEVAAAVSGFSHRMVQGDLAELVEVKNAKALEKAFDQFHQAFIAPHLQAAGDAISPLRTWVEELQASSGAELESIRSLQSLAEGSPPTVMVVDDDGFQHRLIREFLKGLTLNLVCATSGIDALNQLRKVLPDLILIDLSMPTMDGLELTRRIRGIARFTHIPIIMITGNSEEEVVNASLRAGAIDFMVKPLRGDALIDKIAHLLALEGSPSEVHLPDLNITDL